MRTLLLAVIVSAACTASEPTNDTRYAALVQTCAPWDGPAVSLFLTGVAAAPGYPTAPYSAITIYKSVSQIEGRQFSVSSSTSNLGSAEDCPRVGECGQVAGASISFGALAADSTMTVTYRLDLGAGRVLRGAVQPRLYPPPGFCG
jgi:hypothetical protein